MRNPLSGGALLLLAACTPDAPVDRSWQQEAGHRWRRLAEPSRGRVGFTALEPGRTGITFANAVSDSLLRVNRILAQGGGVCLGDVDGDARADVLLTHTAGPNALYRNLGDWRFADITAYAGVAAPERYSSGCALADTDGDGDLDLLLLALGGPNAVFVNDGTGRFTERPFAERGAGSTTATLADVDGDGDLDLYVANYKAYTTLDRMSPQERSFDHLVRQLGPRRFEVREPFRDEYKLVDREDLGAISLVQRADPDFFYRNDGGRFIREPIAGSRRFVDERGRPLVEEREDFGLAALLADLTGDGAPDLYVANDFEDPDQLWFNDGRGGFRLAPWYALRSTSNSTMAVDVSDVNADGLPDLFQVDMLALDTRRRKTQVPTHSLVAKAPGIGEARHQMQRNTLHLNRGDGTFAEVARYAGVGASGWSWSTLFLDVDLDGWEDLLIGTGHRWDLMDGDAQHRLLQRLRDIDWRGMMFEYPLLALPNVAFRNRGDLTFADASRAWRFALGDDLSHGMAAADLDDDGDLDVVINRLGAPAAVLRNDARAPRIAVRLRGEAPNSAGIGSRIRVRAEGLPRQEREVLAGGLYLSSSDAIETFATGAAETVAIEVDWRDGRRSVIAGAHPGRLYEIDQAAAALAPAPRVPPTAPLFEDITEQLGGHTHAEPYVDDFVRQPLLPTALNQLGPGVAWYDIDGDGREDLIVGTGRRGRLAWFRNDGRRLRPAPSRGAAAHLDLTTVLGWPQLGVVAGVSSYEMPSMRFALRVPSVVAYSLATGAMQEVIPGDSGSTGPIAAADYDGDGDLDLFVGARVVPGAYPLAGTSRLFRNEGRGRFVLDAENTARLERLGMVSAALFSDLDGDGWPELLAAVDWGPIRVFRNDGGGRFRRADLPELTDRASRWNGIATGDLDGDGRLDVVATSWGRNRDQQPSVERPLFLYYGFFGSRPPYVILAQEDDRLDAIAPLASFPRISRALPIEPRVRTFAEYADAAIERVLGPLADGTGRLAITTLDHMMFLNRGDRFEAVPLPADAQLAPAFYAGIADFDGDGREDLFLTQNFFGTDVETPRYDAGRSLLLLGDGEGRVTPLPGQRSGIRVYGEQRGAAYADFDGDGRLDLAVSQNAAATRLFRNAGAAPGVRVRLIGPAGNPTAVGAQLRLRDGEAFGPVREIQAGSGYWSHNGAVQVLGRGLAGEPTALWIRWPGGREQTVPLAPGETDITVTMP